MTHAEKSLHDDTVVNVDLFALFVLFLVLMNEICLKSTLAYDNCNYLDYVRIFQRNACKLF